LNIGISLLQAVPAGRVFGLDQQTLISIGIQLLNAVILAAALSFILYKPLRAFLQKRADRIKAQLGRAENDQNRAGELKAQYEKKLEDIELERTAIIESAHHVAAEQSRQIIEKAKYGATAAMERAAADIKLERERAGEAIRLEMIEIATAMAEKFVAHSMDAETQNRLFAETVAELEDAQWLG